MTTATDALCAPQRMLEEFQKFLQEKMCGRCLPCPLGLGQAMAILLRLTRGDGRDGDLLRLSRIAAGLSQAARCRRGKEIAKSLAEALQNEEEFQEHLQGRCTIGTCRALRKFRVIPELCTMCGRCQEVCSKGAIVGDPYIVYLGDNRPYTIRGKKCDGCGACASACPAGAIVQI